MTDEQGMDELTISRDMAPNAKFLEFDLSPSSIKRCPSCQSVQKNQTETMISIETARSFISLDFNFLSPFSFNTGNCKLSTTQAELQACEAQLATEEGESDKKG